MNTKCHSHNAQEYTINLDLETCHQIMKKTYCNYGGLGLLKSIESNDPPEDNPQHPQSSNQPDWYICGHCRPMPLSTENVCCRKRPCVTTLEFFEPAVLDMNVLSIAIVNRSKVFAADPDYSLSSYRKAAYHQWILWNYGYLGRSRRRVIPSCVMWAVGRHYPAPDGNYLGVLNILLCIIIFVYMYVCMYICAH